MAANDKAYAKKKREIDIGLANNAFGAGMGVLATAPPAAMAVRQAVKMRRGDTSEVRPGRIAQAKVNAARKAKTWALKRPRTARALKHGVWALPAAVAAGQAINGAADAQSAAYFARERRALKAQRTGTVTKFDSGFASGVEIDKAWKDRWPANSTRRSYEQGMATGAGLATAGGGAAALGYNLARLELPPGRGKQKNIARLTGRAIKQHPGRLAIPAAMLAGGSALAGRSYRMAQNEARQRWH